MNIIVPKFLAAFAVGAVLMLLVSFSVYRRSYYYKRSQVEAGTSGEKPGLASYLFTLLFLLVAVALFFVFDVWISTGTFFSFIQYSGLNLLLAAFLSTFDALFIDYFILLVWRPSFLAGKEEFPARERMLRHIKLQFSYGWIYKVALALIAAGLTVVFL